MRDHDENDAKMAASGTTQTTAVAKNDAASQPLSDDEIAALAGAARDLLPSVLFVGKPLNFTHTSGRWFVKINANQEDDVGPTETLAVDVRSYAEIWKRWGKVDGRSKRTVTDIIGGRRIDGWINPPRHLLPETDPEVCPRDKDGEPEDPWVESSQIVLRRLSDGQLVTWSAQFKTRRGMGELLDTFAKKCKDHPGDAPIVLLEAVADGNNFIPRLRIVGWEPFGDGASPPANPAVVERLKQGLHELHVKYASPAKPVAEKTKASSKKRGDMDDEIPF